MLDKSINILYNTDIPSSSRISADSTSLFESPPKAGQPHNTAFIERLNGTFRERPASLTRKCRHAAARLETLEKGMYLIGCTYNFCFPHHQLSKPIHHGCPITPAMAAGLTDHIWSIREVLWYKVAPAVWVEPKRRGRSRKEQVTVQIRRKKYEVDLVKNRQMMQIRRNDHEVDLAKSLRLVHHLAGLYRYNDPIFDTLNSGFK